MPMHGLRHIADQLHLHHGYVTLLRQNVPFQWSRRAGIQVGAGISTGLFFFAFQDLLDRLLP
jgi:hypothetical protein